MIRATQSRMNGRTRLLISQVGAVAAISPLLLLPLRASAQAEPIPVCVDVRGCSSPTVTTPVRQETPEERDQKILSRKSWMIPESIRGEFIFETPDGRRIEPTVGRVSSLEFGGKFITGPSGHARIQLPDGTYFTIGPNSEFVFDSFVYDPSTETRTVIGTIVKGLFRWATGALLGHHVTEKLTINTPVIAVGFRGTDVEAQVEPGIGGYIKLYSGEVVLNDYDTGQATISLRPGQMVSWGEDLKIGAVTDIPPGS